MARKKAGSRAAAGQAKARERARRKARIAGPSLAQAAYVAPPLEDAPDTDSEEEAVAEASPAAPSPAPAVAAPAPRAVAAPASAVRAVASPRRERQLAGMTPTGSLKRELLIVDSVCWVRSCETLNTNNLSHTGTS